MKRKILLMTATFGLLATPAIAGWCTVCYGEECIQYMATSPYSWEYCGTEDVDGTNDCRQWEKRQWQCKAGAWKHKFRYTTYSLNYCLNNDIYCYPP